MKRVVFYAGVIIIAICLAGGSVALFWLLMSAITAKISETELSVFTLLLSLCLYMLLSLILTVFLFFSTVFFIYQANIYYKKRTRSFTVLKPDPAGQRKEAAPFPVPYFAGDPLCPSYFVPWPGMLFSNQGARKTLSPESLAGNKILPFPKGRKNPHKGARR
jgi:hypothetical protein